MGVKLLMSWNIRPDRETDYFEFVMDELSPGLEKLGLQPSEAWYTIYGEGPQILMGAVAENLDDMQQALSSEEWSQLKENLLDLVEDYQQKVIASTGRFQL